MNMHTFRSGVERLARRMSFLAIAWVLLLAPTISRAGVNTWTGGRPIGLGAQTTRAIAIDPSNPDVVYAAYDSNLYRSDDGGRRWIPIGSFDFISTLFVHPTSSSTLYLSGFESNPYFAGVFKSEDGGLTWNHILPLQNFFTTFAASPENPSTLYAGASSGWIYKSVDDGDHWELLDLQLAQQIAALVIDPQDDATIYAGGADFDYPEYPASSPFFSRSTDGGGTWTNLSAGFGNPSRMEAIAIDPTNSSTLFVGLANSANSELRGVFRTEDAGSSWSALRTGLPAAANVFSLAMDPQDPRTLYAGTDSGAYQTRDAGASWFPIGQQLRGARFESLALDAAGRVLHAATDLGAFQLELAEGAVDVSSRDGKDRVLSWDAGRLSVRTLEGSGDWVGTAPEGPFGTWTATAISDGADGLSRVLWNSGDGRVALGIVGPAGTLAAFRFDALDGWAAADISVGVNGNANLLWTSATGEMFVASVDPAGAATSSAQYGPYSGWAAVAIADSPHAPTLVLWRCTDGRAALSRFMDGFLDLVFRWGADPGWAAEDIAVGADGLARLLWSNPDGRMKIWTVDAGGRLTDEQIYANPGFEPRRIAASSDGLTRVLWTGPDGSGAVWLFNADNTLNSQLPPIPAPAPITVSGAWTGTFFPGFSSECPPGPAQAASGKARP